MAAMNEDELVGTGRGLGGASGELEQDETLVIRAEIVETRERMGETLDEIGERLNPHVVTERVKDGIRDATIGRVENMARSAADTMDDARSTMMDTIRDNPIPAAMAAVGLGWLFWNGRRAQSADSRRYDYYAGGRSREGLYSGGAGYPYGSNLYTGEGRYAGEQYGSQHAGSQYGSQYGEEEGGMERARERVGELGQEAKERASEAADRAQDMARSVADRTQDVAHTVADRTQDVAHRVADRTRRGARRAEDSYYDNPLAMGAVTMALGLAAGLAIPETDREVEMMGGARDRLVDRVKDAAEDTKEKVQSVASRAMEETKTAAREEGLTGTA